MNTKKINTTKKNTEKKQEPNFLSKTKQIYFSSILYWFSLVYLICLFVFNYTTKPLTDEQFYGALVNGLIILLLAIIWKIIYIIKFKKNGLVKSLEWGFLTLLIPIADVIYLNKYHIKKQLDFKKKKIDPIILFFAFIVGIVLISWLMYVCKGASEEDKVPGVIDIFYYPIYGFYDGVDLIVFLLFLGAFLQCLNHSKALEASICALSKKMKNHEYLFISIFILVFAILGTTYGFSDEAIAFVIILTPLFIALGFDVIMVMVVIFFGAAIGVGTSIINPFTIGSADAALDKIGMENFGVSDGIIYRCIMFATMYVVLTTFACLMVKKYKFNKKSQVSLNEQIKENQKTYDFDLKKKLCMIIFGIVILLMILGSLPWYDWTNCMENVQNWLHDIFPFISTNSSAITLGNWYMDSYALVFFLGAVAITIINWKDLDTMISNFFIGFKDFLGVAMTIAFSRGFASALDETGLQGPIVGFVASGIGFNQIAGMLVMLLGMTLLGFLMGSQTGYQSGIFPIFAQALDKCNYSVSMGIIMGGGFSTAYASLVSPTNAYLNIALSQNNLNLKTYYKNTWKLSSAIWLTMAGLVVVSCFLPAFIVGK